MEEEMENVLAPDDLPARKRVRHDLETSMKRVQISPLSSGQLRLQNDVTAYHQQKQPSALHRQAAVQLRIDPRNPLHLSIQISPSTSVASSSPVSFTLVCEKRYPHKPPHLLALPSRHAVDLPVLRQWLPVNSLADILRELLSYCK